MDGFEIITLIFAGSIGAFIGVGIEFLIDNKIISELQERNKKLTLENIYLKQKSKVQHEVIEIVDNTVAKDVKFGGF